MTPEETLAKVVAEWCEGEAPGDQAAAAHAVEIALGSYRAGRSVSDASREARVFVGGWVHHPVHRRADRATVLGLAS